MLYLSAAIFTLAAWGIQAYVTAIKKSGSLSLVLPLLYLVTCVLFLVEAVAAGDVLYIILNAVLLILVAGTAFALFKRRKTG